LTRLPEWRITCLFNMKTANVRQLRHAFGEVMVWIADGEQVEIVKKGKIIALLSPPPRPKSTRVKLPDFAARQKRLFGDRILPGNIVAEEREISEW
jgi:antitoxin (DNA-binding transcriptional repressor) of toxin-antitoxin stability system